MSALCTVRNFTARSLRDATPCETLERLSAAMSGRIEAHACGWLDSGYAQSLGPADGLPRDGGDGDFGVKVLLERNDRRRLDRHVLSGRGRVRISIVQHLADRRVCVQRIGDRSQPFEATRRGQTRLCVIPPTYSRIQLTVRSTTGATAFCGG